MKTLLQLGLLISLILYLPDCDLQTETETDLTPPAIPTGLVIVAEHSGDGQIMLSWNANSERDFDRYRIYRSLAGDVADQYSQLAETQATTYVDAGLEYTVDYYYRISAIDENDNESERSAAVHIIPININPPQTPANFRVYGYNLPNGNPYIDLRWSANSETDLDYYAIYRDTIGLFPTDAARLLQTVTVNYYIDENVTVGQKLYYKLIAVDRGGMTSNPTGVQSDLPLAVPVLSQPANNSTLTATPPTFIWNISPNATKYKLIVRLSQQSDEFWTREVTQPTSGTTVTLPMPTTPALASARSYYWQVAAYSSNNSEVNSYSLIWKFTTP